MSIENQKSNDGYEPQYTPLSPLPNSESSKHYIGALNYAINEKRISNIAITGSYGSGKSTIIETYIEQYPKKGCIKISLAEFTDEEPKQEGEVSKKELERSILQQLFYQRDASNFPDSRFDRIQKKDPKKIGDIAIFILVYLGLIATILFKGGFEALFTVLPFFDEDSAKQVLFGKTAIYIAFMSMSYFVLFAILNKVKSVRNFNLKLETIGEIAIDKQEDTSILNLYFDEIRYYFEQSNVNVVFIEDLDRFKKLKIELFTKLREINLLVNSSLKASGSKCHQVNFVYALKDELFTEDGERTKFFDFLIPVIPFVNYSNTGAKLFSGLQEHQNDIGKEFIFELSPYISEMRLVHNIINEFKLYLLNLRQFVEGVDELITKKKLFAFIVYKNVFPVDFSKLNSGKGQVFRLLEMRLKILQTVATKLNTRIDKLQSDTADSKRLIHNSLEENKLLLAAKLLEKLPSNVSQFYIANTVVQRQSKSLYQIAELLIKSPRYKLNQHSSDLPFEEEVSEYLRKEELINFLDKSKEAENKISKLRSKIRLLREKTLAELLQEYPEQEHLLNECLKSSSGESTDSIVAIDKNQLLIKLVRSGYIDNSYHHYLTYYHPTSEVSLPDWQFILHVKDKAITDKFQEYPIQNVAKVFDQLRTQDFEYPASWNISLVDYLLQNENSQAIDSLILGFVNDTTSLIFIKKYFETKQNFELLMKQLSIHWPEVWDELTKTQTAQENSDLLVKLLDDLDTDSWESLAIDTDIKDFIESDIDFIEKVRQVNSVEHLKPVFKILDIKFRNLNLSLPLSDREQAFLDIVTEEAYYEFNDDMLRLLISLRCPDIENEYSTKQLSVLLEGGCDVVRKHFGYYFYEYLEKTYIKLDTPQQDSEEFLLRLFNNKIIKDLSLEAKYKIIKKQKTRFSNIEKIHEKSLWELAYNLRIVIPTWENVARFFQYNEEIIGEALLSSLSDSAFVSELCRNKMIEKDIDGLGDEFEGITYKLCTELITKTQIPDNKYREIVNSIPYRWKSYPLYNLNKDKVRILIEEDKLTVSQENLDGLIDYEVVLALKFVAKNLDDLVKKLTTKEIEFKDINFLKSLLVSDELSTTQKNEFISVISEDVLTEVEIGSELSQSLLQLIDAENRPFNFQLLDRLISSEYLSLEEKLNILSNQVEFITEHNSLHKLLVHLGEGYDEIFTKGTSYVTIEDTRASRRFIDVLKHNHKDWIGKTRFKDSRTNDVIHIYVRKLT